jgi:hypothetical protein
LPSFFPSENPWCYGDATYGDENYGDGCRYDDYHNYHDESFGDDWNRDDDACH